LEDKKMKSYYKKMSLLGFAVALLLAGAAPLLTYAQSSEFKAKFDTAIPAIDENAIACGPIRPVTVEATCKAAVDAKKKYFSYMLTFDVTRVVEGEFNEKEVSFEAVARRVRPQTPDLKLIDAVRVESAGGSFRCDATIPVNLKLEIELGDRGLATRATLKDVSLIGEPGSELSLSYPQRPSTARDYLMILPEKYFVFESCDFEKDRGCEQARRDYLKRFVEPGDITDTYIKGGCDGAQSCMEMSIFAKPDGSHLVAIGKSHEGLKEYYFLDYRNGEWMDVSTTAVPGFSKRHYYGIPRTGMTMKVFEGKVTGRGEGYEVTEKGQEIRELELEWKNGKFRIKPTCWGI
jgi:hypothetical protein